MHQPKATTQLQIRTDQSSLGVCEKDWRDALEDASTDPKDTRINYVPLATLL